MTRFQEKSIMVELQSSDLDYLSWAHSKPALNPHYDSCPHYSLKTPDPETYFLDCV